MAESLTTWRTPAAPGDVQHAPVLLDLVGVVTTDQEHRLDAVERRAERPRVVEGPHRHLDRAEIDGLTHQRPHPVGTGELLDDGAADLPGRSRDEDHRGGASRAGSGGSPG